MFQGASALALDAKGRLNVPVRHRELIAATANGQITITRHLQDECLMIFPRPAWEQFREKISALPVSAVGWKRKLLGNAMDVEIDSAARILISPELRKVANLTRDVMLLGMGSHLELWDSAAYAASEAALVQSEMPAALQDLSF